jgi:hypothetical protein
VCANKSDESYACVTGDQLAVIAAAGAPEEMNEAPAGSAASGGTAEPASTTTPLLDGSSTQEIVSPANDNEPAASSTPDAANDNPQPQGAEQPPHDGNSPVEPLPATGTLHHPIRPHLLNACGPHNVLLSCAGSPGNSSPDVGRIWSRPVRCLGGENALFSFSHPHPATGWPRRST